MQKNIIGRIALCGLLTAANITLAMWDIPTQTQLEKKTVLNGYYTNNLKALPYNLPIYTYNGEKGVNNGISKITYINTETNATQTVRFSGKNNLNEFLEYDNEKYHVIIDSEGKNLFAIKMNQTPTPSTSSGNSSTQRSGSISPRDDYDDSNSILPINSQSNSGTNSPRGKQIIGEILGGEKQIIHELILENTSHSNSSNTIEIDLKTTSTNSSNSSIQLSSSTSPRSNQIINEMIDGKKLIVYEEILDNTGRTYKQTSPTRDTITGLFTKDLSSNIPEIPVYDYISHQKVDNTHAEFTYKANNTIKTITLEFQNKHDDEEFLFVQENVMGLIKQYVINLNPEEVSTDSNSENGNSSTNSDETSLQDSEPKQQLQGSFIPEILNNMDYYEGVKITQTHELHMKGFTTENFTLYPSDNYQYQIEYKNKTGDICTAIFNCSQQLQTTSAYIITETDPILAIKLPTQEAKTTQLTSSNETLSEQTTQTNNNNNNNDSSNVPTAGKLTAMHTFLSHFYTMSNDYMPEGNYPEYEGEITESTKHSSKVTFIDNNNVQQEVWIPGTPENATHVFIKNSTNKIQCAIKLPTQEIQDTPIQTVRGSLTSNFDDLSSTSIKQYQGEITNIEGLNAEITYTDNNKTKQTIWVDNTQTSSIPTYAIIKDSHGKAQFVIKLPTEKTNVTDTDSAEESRSMNNNISKKSTSQRFNKNPNNRDPKYTYIGAAFLTLCIALAYKYNKLPDTFTQLLDTFFVQCRNLMPSHFTH